MKRFFQTLRGTASPPAPPPERPGWAPTHQHKKGGYYRMIGLAILEADRSEVVLYDDAEGTTWVRDRAEFEDGRFRPLTTPER